MHELIRVLITKSPFLDRYRLVRARDIRRLLEHNRLLTEAATERARKLQEREAEFAALLAFGRRADFETLASSLADSRRGHEQALRELEEARAEAYELSRLNHEAQLANQDLANQLSGFHNEQQQLVARLGSLQMELREAQDRNVQLITEGQKLKDQLAGTLDENRRLSIRVNETPAIDYQLLMRQQHEEAAFRDADPAFMELYERVKPFSMTSTERLYAMYKATEYVSRAAIPGCIVECGVWRGGSMMLAALTLLRLGDTERKLILFDTFEGLPKPNQQEDIDIWGHSAYDEWTRHQRSDTSSDWACASLDEVRQNMVSTGYPVENLIFVKGMVQETLPQNRPNAVSLLRLDTDWYESTVCELQNLYPVLSNSGVLIVDDYGHLRGQRKAVDEYFAARKEVTLLHRIDYSARVMMKYQS
jgi:Macrocin-O-methyltransferase (TylF)